MKALILGLMATLSLVSSTAFASVDATRNPNAIDMKSGEDCAFRNAAKSWVPTAKKILPNGSAQTAELSSRGNAADNGRKR